MKNVLFLLCAALLAASAPLAPAQTMNDSVPVDFFYDALSPYGDWVYTPNYGYVWQPLAAQQPGWAPYADGSWAYTDAGWTWMSNEDFGWLTYHYGRWIRLMQNWVWVPGYDWAPAWVSWRQTQGQIGWAPLPPEAAWVPGTGFGGWTDSYYDVGPAYYNFVPMAAFASRTSLRPFILDRSRNFFYYDQSVNVTHTTYQPNVMNHIFVGGPDPQRIDRFGGNPVRRLTLRRDDEGFRRDWLEHRAGGGPPRGAGNPSRIEQDQLVVAAPNIRRGVSHALPAKVREPMHQVESDRGWRGMADAEGAERLRQQQRDELARTRPPNLPEKRVVPATSTAPPPAFGRVLQPEERLGTGAGARGADPRHGMEETRPALPISANTPPGIPGKRAEEPGSGGGFVPHPQTGLPHREHRGENPQPGQNPGEAQVPPAVVPPHVPSGFPQAPHSLQPQPVVPPQGVPATPGMPHERPGHHEPGQGPGQQPVAPPHTAPSPLPATPPRQPPHVQPMPPPGGNAPHPTPTEPPHHIAPQGNPGGQGRKR